MNDIETLTVELAKAEAAVADAKAKLQKAWSVEVDRQYAVLRELYRAGSISKHFLEREFYLSGKAMDLITGEESELAKMPRYAIRKTT